MNLLLKRNEIGEDGAFSDLTGPLGSFAAVTLEHVYAGPNGSLAPKIPPGVYTCVRGIHQLHDGIPFETFEITGVPGHTGLLFHCGNDQNDSEGCVLVATNRVGALVTQSRLAFGKFMAAQEGLNSFPLTVE